MSVAETPEIQTRRITIAERIDPEGDTYWVVEDGGIHDSAAEALARVRSDDARMSAATGISRATVISWEPVTVIGAMAVKAIQ